MYFMFAYREIDGPQRPVRDGLCMEQVCFQFHTTVILKKW